MVEHIPDRQGGAGRALKHTGDLVYKEGQALPAFGKLHSAGFLAAFADASVRTIPNNTPSPTIKAFITPDGNEVIPPDAP